MHSRKAASVLPEPVGAEIKTSRPSRITGHPSSCGSVAWPKRDWNQSATSGSKDGSTTLLLYVFRLAFALEATVLLSPWKRRYLGADQNASGREADNGAAD